MFPLVFWRKMALVVVFGSAALHLLTGCQDVDDGVARDASAAAGETLTVIQSSEAAMDLPTAIASADAIVVGNVSGKQWTSRGVQMSEWGRERQHDLGYSDAEVAEQVDWFKDYVFTHSTFAIERTLKGDFPVGRVEVWTIGGEFEGHRCEAPGKAQLHPGTQYILFLGRAFHGGYVPLAIYEVRGGRATTSSQGRNDDMTVDELLAIIDKHKDDPFPWVPSSQELRDLPPDPEDHPMIPEEERGITSETTTAPTP